MSKQISKRDAHALLQSLASKVPQADLNKLINYVNHLEKMIDLDELTGLLNKHGLRTKISDFMDSFNRLSKEVEKKKKNKKADNQKLELPNLSVIYIDLDNFKQINDKNNHSVGDEIIKAFAQKLDVYFKRNTDKIARLHGDEFCVIALLSPTDSANYLERLNQKLAESGNLPNLNFPLSASYGIVELNPFLTDPKYSNLSILEKINLAINEADELCQKYKKHD